MVINIKKSSDKEIIYITTSISSLAIISLSDRLGVDKHVAISPFLGLSLLAVVALKVAGLFPRMRIPRRATFWLINTSKSQLQLSHSIPIASICQIQEKAKKIRESQNFDQNFVVLHSQEDLVASYRHSAKFFRPRMGVGDFVTLAEAPHVCAHLINAKIFLDLISEHYWPLNNKLELEKYDSEIQKVYEEVSEEHRFWSGKIFNIVIGFLAAFSFLIYQTLDMVVAKDPKAPYFLLSYTSLVGIYVILASQYFFMANRAVQFMVTFVEPSMFAPGYSQFKLTKEASGRESPPMTFATSVVISIVPLCVAIFSFFFLIYEYHERIVDFGFYVVNSLLQFWTIVNVFLVTFALRNMNGLAKVAVRRIHGQPLPIRRTVNKSKILLELLMVSKLSGGFFK